MAGKRKILAVGAGAATATAVAASAIGIQVTVSDVSVSSITGSGQFTLADPLCDADVNFTNGASEITDDGVSFSWNYSISTPAAGVACSELRVQATTSNGDAIGDVITPVTYTPSASGEYAELDTATGNGVILIEFNPDEVTGEFERLHVIGIP